MKHFSCFPQVEEKSGIKIESEEQEEVDLLSNNLGTLNTTDDKNAAFEAIDATVKDISKDISKKKENFTISTGEDKVGYLNRSLLTGNIELAVEICLDEGRMSEALILAQQGGQKLIEKTQKR